MQGHAYNPMLQLPYHEMTVPLPKAHPWPLSICVPDLEAGPSSWEWTHH